MVVNVRNLKKLSLLCACLFFVVSVTGCGLFPKEDEVMAPPLLEPEEIKYATAEVVRGYMENSIEVVCPFVPVKSVDCYFQDISGRLKDIYVRPGQAVKKGDLIAELIADDLEKNVENLLDDVQTKEINLEHYLSTSEIDLELAERNLEKAVKKLEDMELTPELYSEQELRNAREDVETQKLSLKKQKLNIQNQIDTRTKDLEKARERLAEAQEMYEKTKLYAPIDGQITYLAQLRNGVNINIFQVIATVSDLTVLQIEYTGTQAEKFQLGMKVEVFLDNEVYNGEVVMTPKDVPPDQFEQFRNTVRFELENMPEYITRGKTAKVKLLLEKKDDALMVPRSAVKQFMGEDVVYVLEDNLRVEKNVVTGIQQGNFIEIVEGLTEGEIVILN